MCYKIHWYINYILDFYKIEPAKSCTFGPILVKSCQITLKHAQPRIHHHHCTSSDDIQEDEVLNPSCIQR